MRALRPRSPHLPTAFRGGSLPVPRSAGEDKVSSPTMESVGEYQPAQATGPKRYAMENLSMTHSHVLSACRRATSAVTWPSYFCNGPVADIQHA
jgi:hypothetical protein